MQLVGSYCSFHDEIFNSFPPFPFSFEFCIIGGGVQGQRADVKGQEMYRIKTHDVKDARLLEGIVRMLFWSVWGSHAPSYKSCKYKNVAVIKEKRHLQMTDLFTTEKVSQNETLELGRVKWNYYSLKRKQPVGLRKCCIGRTEITVYHIGQTKHVNNCEQK